MSKPNNPTISEKIAQLDELVAWFDSDDFSLEQAITHYEKAEALARDIETDLDAMKSDIRVLKKRFDE